MTEERWERRNGVREEGVRGREVDDRSGGQSRKEKMNRGNEGRIRIFLFSLSVFSKKKIIPFSSLFQVFLYLLRCSGPGLRHRLGMTGGTSHWKRKILCV